SVGGGEAGRMAENETQLTAEMLVDSEVPRNPVVSPDGRTVAYVVSAASMRDRPFSSLWVVGADGESAPRRVTPGTAWDGAPRWAPDSASLLFLSDRQLHRIPVHGGDVEVLTAWRGGILDHLPLADGRTVAVVAVDEPDPQDERRVEEGDDAVVWGERVRCARLRLLDLDTGALRTMEGLGDRHVVEVVQRPDGGALAVVSWACPEDDPGALTAELHVLDLVTGGVHDLGPAELETRAPTWWEAADGWHLMYLAMTPPGTAGAPGATRPTLSGDGSPVEHQAVLDFALPLAGPAAEHRNLTADMSVCPTELAQVAGGPPLAHFADGLDTALFQLVPATGRFGRLCTRTGIAHALTASRTGDVVAVLAGTAYEPKNVHAGPTGGPLVRLSDTRPQLRRIRWGSQERLSWKASDGLVLDGLLLLPPGRTRADGPFPLVTLAHGGPYGRFADEWQLHPVASMPPAQWLATAGYAVFLPNPRGGQGHGPAFAAAVEGAAGTADWPDIEQGIDLLVAEGVADPDRLGVGGWSHGGFMAAWAVGQTDRFKAALVGAGISDWGMQAATGEVGARESALSGSMGWEGPGPHPHDRLSPISYASRISTPVLIVHGEDDTNVPVGQAVYLHRALRRFGVEHEFVVYPREGHMLVERAHQLDFLRRTRAWFDRWLGVSGVPEPAVTALAVGDGQ
ncbi:MAG TPA: prolyl oligopeptidase family serine peptidase, partial [Streptosporangiaceae bacterium]|nr:prolyl oligopeptidase family serine peptidase [Streptosporangiaceae bacterium]